MQVKQELFWSKVEKTDSCWLWRGNLDRDGYGYYNRRRAHRVAYVLIVGPIPAGLTIDHLCRVRNCVNPQHLDAVTQRENVRRAKLVRDQRTRCANGHEWTPENTYTRRGIRFCRTCNRDAQARRQMRLAGGLS